MPARSPNGARKIEGNRVSSEFRRLNDRLQNQPKAGDQAGFHPSYDVKLVAKNLIEHMETFPTWDNPRYYNIDTLKLLQANGLRPPVEVAR